jgi:hypothetical protein
MERDIEPKHPGDRPTKRTPEIIDSVRSAEHGPTIAGDESAALHRLADQNDQFKNVAPLDFKREHPERLRFQEILEQLADEWEAGSWPPRNDRDDTLAVTTFVSAPGNNKSLLTPRQDKTDKKFVAEDGALRARLLRHVRAEHLHLGTFQATHLIPGCGGRPF